MAKLGALKSAIRAMPGAPHIRFNLANKHPITVDLMKGSILAALDEAFPDGRTFETGLMLNEDGFIVREEDA